MSCVAPPTVRFISSTEQRRTSFVAPAKTSAQSRESVLQQHPAVKQVAVAAGTRRVLATRCWPRRAVEAKLDDEAGVVDITLKTCLDRLAYYKAPGWVSCLQSRLQAWKIQRGALPARCAGAGWRPKPATCAPRSARHELARASELQGRGGLRWSRSPMNVSPFMRRIGGSVGHLRASNRRAGFADIDGFSVSSSRSVRTSGAIGFTQHFGSQPTLSTTRRSAEERRRGSMFARRRAVQAGDADMVACVANHVDPSGGTLDFSSFRAGRGLSLRLGGPNARVCASSPKPDGSSAATREGFRSHLRRTR